MKINLEALNGYLTELNDLSNKATHSPQEKRRFAFLQTAVAAVRSGASVEEVDDLFRNDAARRAGITLPKKDRRLLTADEETEAREWKEFCEQRDVEGAPMLSHIGTFTSLGYFVPNAWLDKVVFALKAVDVLFDPESVTYIRSTDSRPLPIPVVDDTTSSASAIGEGSSESETDIASPNHVVLGGYSYRTPRYQASIESMQDLTESLTVMNLFTQFSKERLARGIGRDLVSGDGSNKPLGLVTSLVANGAPTVIAQGSAVNDGSSAAGYNSLGSQDFSSAISKLDNAYLESDKVAFLMNRKTLSTLEGLTDKVGRPLGLVRYVEEDGQCQPYIYGVRVKICPSMDNIGTGAAPKYPVVLGDLSFFATRIIAGSMSGVMSYSSAPGLIENGLVGLRSYLQADGQVLFTDWSNPSASPFVLIENAHS